MRFSTLRPILVLALLAACSRSDSTRTANVDTTVPKSAPGNVGSYVPADTISERADRGRILGDSTAPLWVIMASDFQCPFCKTWHDQQFEVLMREYGAKNRVRLAFLNYPLSIHPNAMPAAETAMCSSVQGKFWPVHEGLFATQKRWETMPNASALFDSLAASAGVNMPAYRQCVSKHLTVPLIEADRERLRAAGVRSTPTFFVGAEMSEGADQNIRAAIEAALAQGRGAKKPGN
jgi:protein-disulfide isomerase